MTARTREIASLDVMRLAAAQAVMFYHLVFMSRTCGTFSVACEAPGGPGILRGHAATDIYGLKEPTHSARADCLMANLLAIRSAEMADLFDSMGKAS